MPLSINRQCTTTKSNNNAWRRNKYHDKVVSLFCKVFVAIGGRFYSDVLIGAIYIILYHDSVILEFQFCEDTP